MNGKAGFIRWINFSAGTLEKKFSSGLGLLIYVSIRGYALGCSSNTGTILQLSIILYIEIYWYYFDCVDVLL